MLLEGTIGGTMCPPHDRAEWRPLIELVGVQLVGWFMWMFELELVDGCRVHAYKHIATRRYIHLAHDGRAFAYAGDDRYRVVEPGAAIDSVFAGWEAIAPEPDEEDLTHVARARARHRRGR
jgi:hypothetical protein